MITTDQIAALKKAHGNIIVIVLEEKYCVIRQPTRRDYSLALISAKRDINGFASSILDNCWIEGDDEIKSDDDYFLEASSQVDELFKQMPKSIFKKEDQWHLKVGDASCVLRKVDRALFHESVTKSLKNPILFGEMILENCWISGDECIKNDDAYFIEAQELLDSMIRSKKGSIKKY
jgi:hypothetical protein